MKNSGKNNLSVLVLSVSMLFTTGASAQIKGPPPPTPPEFVGAFTLKSQGILLVSAKHELIIFALNQEAQDYIKTLRTQNYACQNIDARHVKCWRFMKDLQAIDSTFENVYDKYKSEKLEIFASDYPAELIDDADYLTEWKRSQNAAWLGQKFTDLHYRVIKDPILSENIVKMKFTNDADQRAYFYVVDHPAGADIAFQHKEILKLNPANRYVRSESMNCLLEVRLTR